MNQAQKDLLIELSRKERTRLFKCRRKSWVSVENNREISKEIDLLTLTINQLKGGK